MVGAEPRPVETVELVGGELCLDFTNTASRRGTETPEDRLGDYDDLVTWAERVQLLRPGDADRLRREARQRTGDAIRVVARARALRERIYRVFSAAAAGEEAAPDDLRALSDAVSAAARHRSLAESDGGFAWKWVESEEPLEDVLWPIAQSAADLLTSDALDRVKECHNQRCTWLFVDQSRNRSRRWCDMKDCGNRAKARRHYARTKRTTDD